VWCDADLVWTREIQSNIPAPSVITFGQNPNAVPGCASGFGGTIFSAQHDEAGRDPLERRGDLRMQVRLREGRAGQRDPLVVTGRSGRGDMLIIEYVDAHTVRFGLDHWGTPMVFSEPVAVDFAQRHTIDVSMPSLQAVTDATVRDLVSGKMTVTFDGTRIWRQAGFFFPAEAPEVAIGRNPIGGTSCGPVFTGDVLSARRIVRE
jgi:hypothetical protein